ncbi:MAG: UbiA family prenyltransferase [Bacteroidia bacterium]|nr:UbiA family prenyltransferase [Bacteroidia bacterium]
MGSAISQWPESTRILALRRFFRMVLALFWLSRPVNLFLMSLTSLFATVLVLRENPSIEIRWAEWFVMVFSVVGIAAGGYWLNDLYDRAIDRVNRPQRARWVALVGQRTLFTATGLVWLGALSVTFLLPFRLSLLHAVAVGALAWYARWGKKKGLIGNATIAVLTGLIPWEVLIWLRYTAYAVDWMIPLSVGFNFVRELVKDAEDVVGDRLYGVVSFPSRLSDRLWELLLFSLWIALMGLSIAPALVKGLVWKVWPWKFLVGVGIGTLLPLTVGLIYWKNYRIQSLLLKVAMAGGLIALWLL